MKPLNQEYLYKLVRQLEVLSRTIDTEEYTIPEDKMLMLDWGTEADPGITIIRTVLIQDGAGVEGKQMLLELCDETDVCFDAFFDDCPLNLEKRLKLIDNPFTK